MDVIGTKVDVLGNGNCGFYSLIKGLILAGNQVLIDLFGYPQDDGVTMYEYVIIFPIGKVTLGMYLRQLRIQRVLYTIPTKGRQVLARFGHQRPKQDSRQP